MASCLCSGSRGTKVVDEFLAETLTTPPAFKDDEQVSKRIYNKISTAILPQDVSRDTAFVNVDAHGSSHPAPTMRRMSSIGGARLSFDGGSRASSVGIPKVVEDGFRVSNGNARASQDLPGGPQLLWTESRQILEVDIHVAKAQDHASWQPDHETEEERLRQRLDKLKLDMQVVQGDGNCQFRAVSQGLWGTQEYHLNVRQRAVGHMREHPEEFEAFLGEGIESYLASMAKPGTWGDELTLRATADSYGMIINVLTSDQHNWFMRYKPRELKLLREVFLTYISPVHYNAIRRRSTQANLQRRLSFQRSSSSIKRAAVEKAKSEQQAVMRISEGAAEVAQQKANADALHKASAGASQPADGAALQNGFATTSQANGTQTANGHSAGPPTLPHNGVEVTTSLI